MNAAALSTLPVFLIPSPAPLPPVTALPGHRLVLVAPLIWAGMAAAADVPANPSRTKDKPSVALLVSTAPAGFPA